MSKWKVEVRGSMTKRFIVSAETEDEAWVEARHEFSFNDMDHDLAVDEHMVTVQWVEEEKNDE